MQIPGQVALWSTGCLPIPRSSFQGHLAHRLALKARAVNRSSEPSTPESPLSVITHDLDYLEKTFGISLHGPLESVLDAHDQVVCKLNPIVAEERMKELDTKLQDLHKELTDAHKAIHDTEERMKESLQYVTDMEKKMSKLSIAHPDLRENTLEPLEETKEISDPLPGSSKRTAGIVNNLELSNKLKEHWYPVEFSSKLKADGLLPLELFGEKWVLFRDKKGVAACLQDECAVRSCPLSSGRVCDGHVQCLYHGLEFDSNGECVKMPSTQVLNDVRVKTLPIAESDGFIWIWPGETTPKELPDCVNPPNDFEIHSELMLEVPVEHGLLLENLLDLAHAPFTHTSTFAKGWPIPDAVKFHAQKLLGGNWDPYPIDMSFETPCMVLSLIGLQQPGKIERGARASSCAHHLHQLHVCLPTNDRTTKLLYRMSLDFMHWTRGVPGIQTIWGNVAKQVMGEDLILVEGQQDRMLRGASVWRNPVTYDKLGVRYRRWRNAASQDERQQAAQQLKMMSAGEIFALEEHKDS